MARRPLLVPFLIVVLAVIAPAKTESWLEVRTPHFIVLTNSSERQARQVADQFERMRAVFHKRFPNVHVDPGFPIIVIALKDKKDFQALEPEAYLAKGHLNLAGLFLRAPDKNYVLLRLDVEGEHPYASVYHEYTHLITGRAEEWLPLWLDEGWAEFYQNTEIKEKEVLLGEPSSENLLLLRQNRLLPLATLLAVDRNSPYYHEENKGSIFYAESWVLTHYLEIKDRQENTERLMAYTKLVSNKVDAVTAATSAFGDLKVLEKNLERYVSQANFYAFRMPGSTEVDDSAFKVETVTLTQADAVRADFLAYNRRVKDSRALLDRVLHEDPNNVIAHETMGLLAFREGKLGEAEKWYEQAVKLDSQSFLAHYYYAAIAMQEGPSDDRAAQIEASLRAATKLNPSFAPAFDRLAVFYGMQHKNLDEAHMFSLTAVQLDPTNIGFRLNAANVLLQMERPKDAIAVLQHAMKLATNPEQVAAIQSRVESLQQYQAEREEEEHEYREARQHSQSGDQSSPKGEQTLTGPQELDHSADDRHGPRGEPVSQLHPSDYVNDFARVLDQTTMAQLDALCQRIDQKAHAQIAIVTVNSLDGSDIESYAVDLFKKWGIGGKSTNRGVLILLAVRDRRYRIEVGYGLEPILPDGKVGGFGREAVPLLRRNDYGGAVLLMTSRVADVIAQDAGIQLVGARAGAPGPGGSPMQPPTPPAVAQGTPAREQQPQPPSNPGQTAKLQYPSTGTPKPSLKNNQLSPGSAIDQAARAAAANRGGYAGESGDYGLGQGIRSKQTIGPLEILTDTMGVDFGPYLARVLHDVRQNWYNLIPEAARPPLMKKGKVSIQFAIMKDGSVQGMNLISPSGDTALDRGAYVAITTSSPFPPLPNEFGGQYLGLRFHFSYNPPMLSISPSRMVEVIAGTSQQFHAQVPTNDTVIWSVAGRGCSGMACGTIDGAGLYTAPLDIPDPATVTVTAVDASEADSTSVTIVPKRSH